MVNMAGSCASIPIFNLNSMTHYFESLLPKVLDYSQKLDKLALLLDEPWVMAGDSQTQTKLIFRTGGSILVSENGSVAFGKWELLNRANSILIDYGHSAKLYNHGFFDEAVLALKLDGTNDFFVLVNQNRVPDLDVTRYLKDKYLKETRSNTNVGSKVLEGRNVTYNVGNDEMIIHFAYASQSMPYYGDSAYVHGKPAPDGKYKIGFLNNIHVLNGQISKITMF